MSIKIGSLIDERYRVRERIGHGGMAEVYEALDIIYRRPVAIKLIREDVMKNPVNLRRFRNEVMLAASLNHPNIVKVLNHGTVEGRPYIVNEYISGQTLKDTLDFRNQLPLDEAVSIMIQLTSGLSCAHCHNIVHRDIKPQNIFFMPDGTIKLGDFGIAESSTLTNVGPSGEIIGSVHYLAPEISKGKPATILSDIYSTGVTFFELITGRVPFSSADAVSIAISHIREKFPSPKKYLPNCPKEIERIILKCCEKNPKNRYQSAKELYDELNSLKERGIPKEKKGLLSRIFGFK